LIIIHYTLARYYVPSYTINITIVRKKTIVSCILQKKIWLAE